MEEKGKENQSEETKQAYVSDQGKILGLPGRKFKMSIINLQRTLRKRIDNMQEQISNASKKDGNPGKELKKNSKKSKTQLKN